MNINSVKRWRQDIFLPDVWARVVGAIIVSTTAFFIAPNRLPAQAPTCNTDNQSGYAVTICIDAPGDGANVSGVVTVQATVSVTGNNPGVQRVVSFMDGIGLITDFGTPYTFELPTERFIDGQHVLSIEALMRDGVTTAQTTLSVNFQNGVTQPPVNTNQFTPHAPTGQGLRVVATGDGPDGQSNAAAVANMINGWNPDIFLYLGDVYQDGTMVEFYNWYGTQGNIYGQMRNITNPIIGNHEYENGVAPGYFDYWDNVPDYYSYDAGGWHFVALNSDSKLGDYGPGTPQYDWMVQDLNASSAPCTLAYFHHPRYSIGKQGDKLEMSQIWSKLVEMGVDIVLTGHDHNYQRWEALDGSGSPSTQGAVQFVAGGGGHGIQNFVRSDSRMLVGADTPATAYGALHLTLNPNGASFHYTNIQGQVKDSGEIPCVGAPVDTESPTVPQNLTATINPAGKPLLNWSASTDNTAVQGYTIYRDGTEIDTVDGTFTTYVDLSAQSSTSYSYQVDAYDPAGNHSAKSNADSVTTPSDATFTFYPEADTYVQSTTASTNYGDSTYLRTDASPHIRSYLRFNVQGINNAVQSVTLRIHANSGSGIGYDVYTVGDNSWTEAGTTYNNAPAIGGTVGASGPFAGDEWISIDLSSLVTGDGVFSLAVETTGNTAISMQSRESADMPELVIATSDSPPTPTPTPMDTPTPTPTATATAAPTSPPGSFNYTPIADAYVNESNPDNNYDTSSSLYTDASSVKRSYLRFDMSNLSGYVNSATLRVYAIKSHSVGYQVHNTTDNTWVEAAITYNNSPDFESAIASSGSFGAEQWTEVDVTALVNGPGVLNLVLTSTSATSAKYASSNGANSPELIVETSELPPLPTPTPTMTSTPTPAPTAPPGTFNYAPVADAYVNESKPGNNYGTSSSLRTDASSVKRSYLRFDMPDLGGFVDSATLRVYSNSNNSIGFQVHNSIDNTWSESTIVYTNAPAFDSAVAWSGAISAGSWTEVDVSSLVNGPGILNLVLTSTSSTSARYDSSNGPNPPQLIVQTNESGSTPTPTPTLTPTPPPGPTPTPTLTPTPPPGPTPTLTSTPPPGGEIVLLPDADAHVDDANPTTNREKHTKLRVDAFPDTRSYLRFNIASYPAAATSVTLRVYANSGSSSGYNVAAVADNLWEEGVITYENAPTIGNTVGTTGSFSAGTWTEVDVASLVTGDGLVSLALTGINNTAVSLSSREGPNPPELVISSGSALRTAQYIGPPMDAAAFEQWLAEYDFNPGESIAEGSADPDGDGLSNRDEFANHTDPNRADSDNDTLPDLWEVENGLAPTDASGANGSAGDPDRDGLSNIEEYLQNHDPFYVDNPARVPLEGEVRVFMPMIMRP